MPRSLPATPARPLRLAHFVLRTRRLEPMRDWWRGLLRARVVFENDFSCFLTYDDEHHRIAILASPQLPGPPEQPGVGLDHVAFTYAGLGELLGTWERLREGGVEPYWAINHGPTTSLYYRDPDGNQVELQVDNFPDAESLAAWFREGSFERNPIGVPFEPKRLLERYLGGDPLEELVRAGSA